MVGMAEETVRNKVLDLMKICDELGSHRTMSEALKQSAADHIMNVIKETKLGTDEQNHFMLISFITSMVYSVFDLNMQLEELK